MRMRRTIQIGVLLAAPMLLANCSLRELTEGHTVAPASAGEPPIGFPLIEVPAPPSDGTVMAFFASGDGGWADLDATIARAFAAQGIPVVGLNSLKYFQKRRTPDRAASGNT